jgi:arylsulfatase
MEAHGEGARSGGDDVRPLASRMAAAHSLEARLDLLAQAGRQSPDLMQQAERTLAAAPDEKVLQEEGLCLLKVWVLHARGEWAERDYYLCAFGEPRDRALIRARLGIADEARADQCVFLITVDSLRADRCSCNGHVQRTTPAMDALAAKGVNFPRAYATAGQTAQSLPGIMMSNFYQSFGASRLVPAHLRTLAEALSGAGFHTVGINAANPHLSRFYDHDRGFDEFYDFCTWRRHDASINGFTMRSASLSEQELAVVLEDFRAHPETYELLRQMTGLESLPLAARVTRKFLRVDAAQAVRAAFATLDGRGKRFYWLHLMDVHEPIALRFSPLGCLSRAQQFLLNETAASPIAEEVLGRGGGKYGELYDCAVSYVDMNLGILFNYLSDSGLLEHSLVCVTADHGQELLERGVFGHGYDRLAEGVLHVPLVFGGGLAARLKADPSLPVSTLDIAPTILDACGIQEAPASFLGTTLNDARPRPLYGQTFHDGAENYYPGDRGLFTLEPYAGPVRQCCKEKHFCIQDDCLLLRDVSEGSTDLVRLTSQAGGPHEGLLPDAERLTEQARAYFEDAYTALRRVA